METVKGTVLETDMGRGGGEGWQINSFNLNMHSSTIILTSIIVKQQLNYPNIKSVLSSFKVASLGDRIEGKPIYHPGDLYKIGAHYCALQTYVHGD